jgi:hypothetical protein
MMPFQILAAGVVIVPFLVLCWSLLLLLFAERGMFAVIAIALLATCGLKGLAIGAVLCLAARLFDATLGRHGARLG